MAVLGLLAFVLGFVLAAGAAVFVAAGAGVVSFWVLGFSFSSSVFRVFRVILFFAFRFLFFVVVLRGDPVLGGPRGCVCLV